MSYKYAVEEADIKNMIATNPGILQRDLAKFIAEKYGRKIDAMSSVISYLITKKEVFIKRVIHNGTAQYQLTNYPVQGTLEELTRIRHPGRKGKKVAAPVPVQQELTLNKQWIVSHPVPSPADPVYARSIPTGVTPPPELVPPQVHGIPVAVNGSQIVIPFTHMRAAFDVLFYIYNGAAAPK